VLCRTRLGEAFGRCLTLSLSCGPALRAYSPPKLADRHPVLPTDFDAALRADLPRLIAEAFQLPLRRRVCGEDADMSSSAENLRIVSCSASFIEQAPP